MGGWVGYQLPARALACCRSSARLLSAINHQPTLLEVSAERACLAVLLGAEGVAAGSTMPALAVAVHAQYDADARVMDMDCLVSDLDGKDLFRCAQRAFTPASGGDLEMRLHVAGHAFARAHAQRSQQVIRQVLGRSARPTPLHTKMHILLLYK